MHGIVQCGILKKTMNPWHDVEPGKRAPEIVDCLIEVPRGSRNKYEMDKKTGLVRLDRVLYSAVFYPANYGFIPQTYCDDRDPLDILVLGQEPVVPMCILTARPIGVMQMVDENEEDDKIIAIHENDPAFTHYRDISHLPEHTLNELQRFFEDYKALEKKSVRIERFLGRIDALNVIAKSFKLYQESFEDGKKRADAPLLKSEMLEMGGAASRSPSRAVRVEAARRAASRLQEDGEALVSGPDTTVPATEAAHEVPPIGPPFAPLQEEVVETPPSTEAPHDPIVFDSRTLDAYAMPQQSAASSAIGEAEELSGENGPVDNGSSPQP